MATCGLSRDIIPHQGFTLPDIIPHQGPLPHHNPKNAHGPPGNRGRQGSKYLQMDNLRFYRLYDLETVRYSCNEWKSITNKVHLGEVPTRRRRESSHHKNLFLLHLLTLVSLDVKHFVAPPYRLSSPTQDPDSYQPNPRIPNRARAVRL